MQAETYTRLGTGAQRVIINIINENEIILKRRLRTRQAGFN
jgi:hypothetical protein